MNSTKLSSLQTFQQFVRANLVSVIISSACLNLGLTGAATWNVWNTSQDLKLTVERQANLQSFSQTKENINSQIQSQASPLDLSISLATISLGLLAVTSIGTVLAVKSYVRDRQLGSEALEASQQDLLTVNRSLESEARERRSQAELISTENEQLQQDVGELLDVMSEIESGNLTIHAQVNDRATGLVSDTINRLIETLGKTLHQVSMAAYRVDANSKTQKEMAVTVTQNTGKQTAEVSQMLLLTRNVRQSAQNTMKQLIETNRSLVTLQSAVTEGQGTISSLDREIDVLQAGSDRIVQEIKTLGEFVGLADKFVQDQGEIVIQTQILALNASLVAARAAEQRDPNFLRVWHENLN